jgi:hypothetical protein
MRMPDSDLRRGRPTVARARRLRSWNEASAGPSGDQGWLARTQGVLESVCASGRRLSIPHRAGSQGVDPADKRAI